MHQSVNSTSSSTAAYHQYYHQQPQQQQPPPPSLPPSQQQSLKHTFSSNSDNTLHQISETSLDILRSTAALAAAAASSTLTSTQLTDDLLLSTPTITTDAAGRPQATTTKSMLCADPNVGNAMQKILDEHNKFRLSNQQMNKSIRKLATSVTQLIELINDLKEQRRNNPEEEATTSMARNATPFNQTKGVNHNMAYNNNSNNNNQFEQNSLLMTGTSGTNSMIQQFESSIRSINNFASSSYTTSLYPSTSKKSTNLNKSNKQLQQQLNNNSSRNSYNNQQNMQQQQQRYNTGNASSSSADLLTTIMTGVAATSSSAAPATSASSSAASTTSLDNLDDSANNQIDNDKTQRQFNKFVRKRIIMELGANYLLHNEVNQINKQLMEQIKQQACTHYLPAGTRPRKAWKLAKASLRCMRRDHLKKIQNQLKLANSHQNLI